MIRYKKSNTTDKLYREAKENLAKGDKMFLQPHIVVDRLTGKEKVNDEYFKAFKRNPWNKKNPKNQYLEESENEVADKHLAQRKYKDFLDSELERTQYEMKYANEYYLANDALICKRCKAFNFPNNVHCFRCSVPIYLIKNI